MSSFLDFEQFEPKKEAQPQPAEPKSSGVTGKNSFLDFDQFSPPPQQSFSSAAGSFATGANRGLASALGAPVDLAAGAMNLPVRGLNYLAGTKIPTINDPVGGSASLDRLLTAIVGSTTPQTEMDKNLYATGGGVGATAGNLMGGAALKGLGLLPKMLEPILAPANPIKATAYGGAQGEGAYLGEKAVAQHTDSPTLQAGGALAGGLLFGGLPALAAQVPGLWRTAVTNPLYNSTANARQAVGGALNRAVDEGIPFRDMDPMTRTNLIGNNRVLSTVVGGAPALVGGAGAGVGGAVGGGLTYPLGFSPYGGGLGGMVGGMVGKDLGDYFLTKYDKPIAQAQGLLDRAVRDPRLRLQLRTEAANVPPKPPSSYWAALLGLPETAGNLP